MKLETNIEGVLFYKSEPVKKVFLAEFFEISPDDLDSALLNLGESLKERGVQLASTDTTVQIVTSSEISDTIEKLRKDDLSKTIGKAGSETLAIILYRGPLTRAEIDSVRGVNSTFIIRNLMVRGLVERRPNPRDSRSFLYAITPSLLNHLGIKNKEELPEFSEIMDSLDQFESENNPANKDGSTLVQ